MKHLWEVDHAYYCNHGNYYSNECGAHFKRWQDFEEAEGDADIDMNLVFRWDWSETREDEGTGSNYTGDDYYRNGELAIFFVGQRKGLFRYATVEVCRADEPRVIAYLTPRLKHLMELWAPLSLQPTDLQKAEG